MFQASGDDENIAVKINAYGSSTYDYKYGGKANYALVASGGCQWKLSEAGDTWCMPGVLGCVEIYTTNSGINLNRKWGNGISINRIALNAEREYEFYHNLGHTDYYFLAMPSVNWWMDTMKQFHLILALKIMFFGYCLDLGIMIRQNPLILWL